MTDLFAVTTTVVPIWLRKDACWVGKRKSPIEQGKDAFPGGTMEHSDESPLACAVRELYEETGFSANPRNLVLLDISCGRDPRGPTVSPNYYIIVNDEEAKKFIAQDDLEEGRWITNINDANWAFDHMGIGDRAMDEVFG